MLNTEAPSVESGRRKRNWLDRVEKAGNALPDPVFILVACIGILIIISAIAAMEQKYRLRCANVFHAGDGNLHPLIMFDASDKEEVARALAFGADVLELSVALGGTITGEHGVGIEKLAQMCVQFTPEERTQMERLKLAFDPAALLNPGKLIPTLVRCAEGGKMHVRKGLLPFPELPRF